MDKFIHNLAVLLAVVFGIWIVCIAILEYWEMYALYEQCRLWKKLVDIQQEIIEEKNEEINKLKRKNSELIADIEEAKESYTFSINVD